MTANRVRSTALVVLAFAVAFYPLLRWYIQRVGDGSDEPLGVLALVFAVALGFRARSRCRSTRGCRVVALVLLGLYGVAVWQGIPPLLRALPALGAIAFWSGLWRLPGVSMLLVLSLPVVASLQFYLCYPLRLLTAVLTSELLALVGAPVVREGVELISNGARVGVDPPCSGVRMLWMTGFSAAVVATLFEMNWLRTAGLGALALALSLLANALRASLLYFPEAGVMSLPAAGHELTGVVCFLGSLGALIFLARKMVTGSRVRTVKRILA